MRSRTVGQSHLVLESCCAVSILQKLGLTWVVILYVGLESIIVFLQDFLLCISHVPCGKYSSSFLAYPQHQITASLFFGLRPQWAFEHELYMLHSPTRSALSQLNLGLLDTVSILLFICVLIWLHMGSVHQDASGLKHIPLLTPCYIFMWANISNRNSHVGRHVLFSNHHPCSPSNSSLAWVTSLASSL